jgi:hypothetical protein
MQSGCSDHNLWIAIQLLCGLFSIRALFSVDWVLYIHTLWIHHCGLQADINVLQASTCWDISGVISTIIRDLTSLSSDGECLSGEVPGPWAQNVMTDWSLCGYKFYLMCIANWTTTLVLLAVNYEWIFHASACLMYKAAMYSPARNIREHTEQCVGAYSILIWRHSKHFQLYIIKYKDDLWIVICVGHVRKQGCFNCAKALSKITRTLEQLMSSSEREALRKWSGDDIHDVRVKLL